jgi:1-acyl-sn-glycerol-3-phosphate acyltransferase
MTYAFGTVLRVVLGPLLPVVYRMRITGREHIPEGGAILCGNHSSYMDPVFIWAAAPRPVRFMAKVEMWGNPVLGWAATRVWAFPVNRGEPDRRAITRASEELAARNLVGIFPEGTRHHEGMGEPHNGAAFLAIRNDVPVIPIGVAGTDRIKPAGARFIRLPRVTISFGEPIEPGSFSQGGRKERVVAMTTRIMERIAQEMEGAARL